MLVSLTVGKVKYLCVCVCVSECVYVCVCVCMCVNDIVLLLLCA